VAARAGARCRLQSDPRLLLGGLVQSPIPFAYTSSEHSVRNAVTVQPAVLLLIVGGWYVKSADATWTFGWESGAPTVVPLSLGVGHVSVREGWPPINVFASSEWTAYRHNAPTAPEGDGAPRRDGCVSGMASVVARYVPRECATSVAGAKRQENVLSLRAVLPTCGDGRSRRPRTADSGRTRSAESLHDGERDKDTSPALCGWHGVA